MLMKWVALFVFVVGYSFLISVPVPRVSAGLPLHISWFGFVPDLVKRFYDDAYLGRSWARMTLGLVGISPLLITDFAMRLVKRQWFRTNWVLAMPMTLALSLLVTFALLHGNTATLGISPLGIIQVFGGIFSATILIVFFADMVNVVELLDGVSFVVFLNLTALFFHGAVAAWNTPSLRWWAAGLVAVMAPLFWFSSRLAAMNFSVVTTGSLDAQSTNLQAQKANLRITTVFDQQHLVAGFVASVYVAWFFDRHGAATPSQRLVWPVLAFGLVAFATLLSGVRNRLSTENIQNFLESRNSALSGGPEALGAVQRKLLWSCVRNAALRTALFAILAAFGTTLLVRAAPQMPVLTAPLLFAICAMLWSHLAIAVVRQMRFLFSGYSSTLDIAIPVPESHEEEDLPWWQRLWKRAIGKHETGVLGLMVFLGGVMAFFDFVMRIGEWVFAHAPGVHHQIVNTTLPH